MAALALAARETVLRRASGASELVYDARNALALSFSFTGRQGGAFCHVAAYARHVNLGFNQGAALDDPAGRLSGTGRSIRHLRLRAGADLGDPAVAALIDAAVRGAPGASRAGMTDSAVVEPGAHPPEATMAAAPARPKRTRPHAAGFPAGMSGPAVRALQAAGIRSMAELAMRTEREIAALHGMGPKGVRILREALEGAGAGFRPG